MAIDVGSDFYHRLANRNKRQGDGRYTAEDFRERYLAALDDEAAWKGRDASVVVFDFSSVKKIGPSFANEAFAYFTRYCSPEQFFARVKFQNISKVQRMIIEEELESGYTGK